ncbi:hypothetical protein IscW_ISCW007702, partial [Ixodes scapularis]
RSPATSPLASKHKEQDRAIWDSGGAAWGLSRPVVYNQVVAVPQKTCPVHPSPPPPPPVFPAIDSPPLGPHART